MKSKKAVENLGLAVLVLTVTAAALKDIMEAVKGGKK